MDTTLLPPTTMDLQHEEPLAATDSQDRYMERDMNIDFDEIQRMLAACDAQSFDDGATTSTTAASASHYGQIQPPPALTSSALHPQAPRLDRAQGARWSGENNVRQYASDRTDLGARNTLRSLISSIVLSENHTSLERAALLEDCKASAEQSGLGLPFRELLSEPMDALGVPPLMYELMHCIPDWGGIVDESFGADVGTGLEAVQFLIANWRENVLQHGRMGQLYWVVRNACLRRMDEDDGHRLYQEVRTAVFLQQEGEQDRCIEYDISISRLPDMTAEAGAHTIHALINIRDIVECLKTQPHWQSSQARPRPEHKQSEGRARSALVDFLAAKCAWRIEVHSNSLRLLLVDGPDSYFEDDGDGLLVDPRVRLVAPTADGTASAGPSAAIDVDSRALELLLPRALLRPLAYSGANSVVLAPCFTPGPFDLDTPRGFDDERFLHDGALWLDVTIKVACRNARGAGDAERGTTAPASAPEDVPLINIDGGDEDEDLYVSVNGAGAADGEGGVTQRMDVIHLDDHNAEAEWDVVSQVDPTESDSHSETGWVKASWSGRDEDL